MTGLGSPVAVHLNTAETPTFTIILFSLAVIVGSSVYISSVLAETEIQVID